MLHPEIKELIQVNQLREEGKLKEAFQIISELEQKDDLSLKESLSYKLVKADLLHLLGNSLEAIELAKEIYQEFQNLGDLVSSIDALLIQGHFYMVSVNLTQCEDIILQADNLIKIIKKTSSIDLRERESLLLRIKGGIFFFKGEIQQSLKLTKRAYELAKDTGNKGLISASLNNIADKFYQMRDYDKAIKYAKKVFKLKTNQYLPTVLGTLIEINVSKGDIKEAKVYLDQLREYSEKFNTKPVKILYQSAMALILKSSLRARDRIKAEDMFKELAMDHEVGYYRIDAIINLCDLYLTEFRITNDPKIINEIHPYIQELLNIAEKQHLFSYLTETYLLRAKLSLLTLDLKKAKQFLTHAQKMAESYGLKRLAMKISFEHDKLLRKTKMWESLKINQTSLSERLELTGLNEQMENMVKRRLVEVPEISKEDPVMLLILTDGGNLLFSKKFAEDFSFEDDILGGFLTTINYFITEVFSEGLERAIFGQFTLLMMPLQPFLICYIFKGYSYFAHRKIERFLESIQNDDFIWQSLQNFFQKSKSVQNYNVPSLESLITEIFVEGKI